MAAAAVGLGNLWRFPYMVGENGGAAFIVAYLVALLIIALPIMMIEVGIGRLAQGNTVATYRKAKKRIGSIFGWLVVLLTVIISSYYLVITGWTMGYAIQSFGFQVQTFEEFTTGYASLWYFFGVTALAVLVLIKGVSAIERFSKFLMPFLFAVVVLLVIIASTMDGWSEALSFMLQADFSLLLSPQLWIFAVGQAFYTLAIGQGYLITYGSYIPKKTNVPRACLVVAGSETVVALLAGLMIFPYVFTFGHDPGEGSQLAFTILPQVFTSMRGGNLLAILFFSLFFAAAFSSCLAGLKVVVAAIEEEFRLKPATAVMITGGIMVVLGIPSALSFTPVQLSLAGMPFLDFMDQFGGTSVVIASGLIGAGMFSWFVPRQKIHDSLTQTTPLWESGIIMLGRAAPFIGAAIIVWRITG